MLKSTAVSIKILYMVPPRMQFVITTHKHNNVTFLTVHCPINWTESETKLHRWDKQAKNAF